MSFEENLYYGDTQSSALVQCQQMTGKSFGSALVDKGYRGRKEVNGTEIFIPKQPRKTLSYYYKRKERKRYARRAAIEPGIGHLKNDYRMSRCLLKGSKGASLNLALAAAAWNLKLWINEIHFLVLFCPLLRNATERLTLTLNINRFHGALGAAS